MMIGLTEDSKGPQGIGHVMKTLELLRIVREQFALDSDGIHGEPHWMRVRENGLRLAAQTGAYPAVVELFASLHDSRRQNALILGMGLSKKSNVCPLC